MPGRSAPGHRARTGMILAIGILGAAAAICLACGAAPLSYTSARPGLPTAGLEPSPAPGETAKGALDAGPSATPLPLPTPAPQPGPAPGWPPLPAGLVTHGSRDRPYVALTFDMCQKPSKPARFDYGIAKVLVKYGAPATFFLGGDWVRTHPKEAHILAANPLFELGNHSWSHPDMRTLDAQGITQEISRTQAILFALTGKQNRLFRLPYGWYNDSVLRTVARLGLFTIQWDVVTADPAPAQTADRIENVVRSHAQNGSIIIMHANGRGWHTAEALPWIIEYLRGHGYTLVTVSQLLGLAPLPPAGGTAGP